MHISIVLPNLGGGGAERLHIDLANEWIDKGHNVDFFLMKKYGELLPILPEKANVFDINAKSLLRGTFPLAMLIKKRNPDIVLSAMWPLTSITAISWILSGRTGELFLSEHIVLSIEGRENINISPKFIGVILRFTHIFAKKIIAVSKGVKDDMCKISSISEKNVDVIYNPVSEKHDLNFGNHMPKEILWGNDYRYHVLSVGSLKKQKDHETLIRAFSLLSNDISAKLVILGDGPLKGYLTDLICNLGLQDKVFLAGFTNNTYPWYKSADLFVLSSRWEGFGNVIVEALECGVPIVSTDCNSGPREILKNGKYGKLVKVGDYRGLSKAIYKTYKEETNKEFLIERSKDFSVDKIASKYLEYFNE